jgi:hypothetical protein
MVLDFLARLAQQQLPMRVETLYEIDCAHTLQAAGLIEVAFVDADGPDGHGHAVIRGITHEGRAALDRRDDGRTPA